MRAIYQPYRQPEKPVSIADLAGFRRSDGAPIPHVRHHGYSLLQDCCPGASKGNWICAWCQEVFDEPTRHDDCWPRPLQNRSQRSQRFYEWCKENGFLKVQALP